MTKTAHVNATIPEGKGGNCYATGRGKGSSSRVAVANAFKNLFWQTALKGKRITRFTASVVILSEEKPVVESGS